MVLPLEGEGAGREGGAAGDPRLIPAGQGQGRFCRTSPTSLLNHTHPVVPRAPEHTPQHSPVTYTAQEEIHSARATQRCHRKVTERTNTDNSHPRGIIL